MYNLGMSQQPNMGYNPYDMAQRFQAPNNLVRVTGIDGAKAYQMNPNSTVALFDANEDLFYVKSTDGAGFPTIRTFSFEEKLTNFSKNSENPTNIDNFITKNELETFKQEVFDYVKQSISQAEQTEQPITTNGISQQLKSKQSGSNLQPIV